MYNMRFLTRGIHRVLCQRPLLAARQELGNPQLLSNRYEHSKDKSTNKAKDKANEIRKEINKQDQNKKDKKTNDEGKSNNSSGSGGHSDGPHMGYSPIAMKIVPAVYGSALNYFDRNINLGRHLSPCLSIYKRELTSVMSISLRLTGFFLALCVWAVGILGFFGTRSLSDWAAKLEECDCKRSIVNAAKFMLVFPFSYHLVAAVRHLLWHFNIFLTKPEIVATGYVALALSVLLTAALLGLQWGDDAKKAVDMTETGYTANQDLLHDDLDDSEDLEANDADATTNSPEKVNYRKLKEELKAIDLKLRSKDAATTLNDTKTDS
ncbi:uncharacterized protein SdhCL [Drosophila tropicalis]|uniref:uncharacterized protein SdhCL n=1 Tax=Drosophila tropicalis TaxID=46794 RepID=UPI0035AC15AD